MRCVIAFGSFAMICVEFIQMYTLGVSYLEDFWNWFMFFSYVVNLVIVFEHVYSFIGMTYDGLITLVATATALQWAVFYYWFRLVPTLAFFVTFLIEVLNDIRGFIFMFIVCILMVGNAVYIISESYKKPDSWHYLEPDDYQALVDADENPEIIDSTFGEGYKFIDSLFNQYQMTLGNGDLNFGTNSLVWIFYLLTTIFTQITFFNMLVGIMSETFANVLEAKQKHSLMERTKMYADFLWCIGLDPEIKGKRYLYIVRPEEEEEGNALEGNIAGVKRTLVKLEKTLSTQLQDQAKRVTTEVADF